MVGAKRVAAAFALAMMAATGAPAAGEPTIAEVLQRPAYRAAYEAMLQGRKNLPKWMATPDAVADSTTSPGSVRVIDGREHEIFETCKSDDCGRTGFIVMFSDHGEVAKGLLADDEDVFFGDPSAAESKALLQLKNND